MPAAPASRRPRRSKEPRPSRRPSRRRRQSSRPPSSRLPRIPSPRPRSRFSSPSRRRPELEPEPPAPEPEPEGPEARVQALVDPVTAEPPPLVEVFFFFFFFFFFLFFLRGGFAYGRFLRRSRRPRRPARSLPWPRRRPPLRSSFRPPRGATEPREWNLWDLERIAREESREHPERRDEWSYLFFCICASSRTRTGRCPTGSTGLYASRSPACSNASRVDEPSRPAAPGRARGRGASGCAPGRDPRPVDR